MDKAKIGLIGLVGDATKEDPWGTMKRVADIGYKGIEGAGFLLRGDVAENLKRFHDLGLEVLATSASRDQLLGDLDAILPKIIADAKALQAPRVCCWWGPCESREQLLRDAEVYNTVGARLAAEGLKFCYHNHEHEFRAAYHGVYALDILAEHTDPAAVYFEIDVAWVTFGGADPVEVLHRMKGRVPAIHVKDLYGLDERGKFTTVGTGVVNVQGSVRAAIETGVEWAVVEQDQLRNLDAFQTITVSYLNLKEAGLAE